MNILLEPEVARNDFVAIRLDPTSSASASEESCISTAIVVAFDRMITKHAQVGLRASRIRGILSGCSSRPAQVPEAHVIEFSVGREPEWRFHTSPSIPFLQGTYVIRVELKLEALAATCTPAGGTLIADSLCNIGVIDMQGRPLGWAKEWILRASLKKMAKEDVQAQLVVLPRHS